MTAVTGPASVLPVILSVAVVSRWMGEDSPGAVVNHVVRGRETRWMASA